MTWAPSASCIILFCMLSPCSTQCLPHSCSVVLALTLTCVHARARLSCFQSTSWIETFGPESLPTDSPIWVSLPWWKVSKLGWKSLPTPKLCAKPGQVWLTIWWSSWIPSSKGLVPNPVPRHWWTCTRPWRRAHCPTTMSRHCKRLDFWSQQPEGPLKAQMMPQQLDHIYNFLTKQDWIELKHQEGLCCLAGSPCPQKR